MTALPTKSKAMRTLGSMTSGTNRNRVKMLSQNRTDFIFNFSESNLNARTHQVSHTECIINEGQ